ncbi:hypothetical protein [Nitratifractor salsuginis]|uniref:SUA5/yciO/yrdC domain protein n=1 Tax=Nitratifractor salsuginis (strain DSM 16511 / JCM 12458 / E9I37-1) TaxID=749222 RepID=E6WYG4_NITSE|nr:hypothetical protein [Nitratifractor salsuginis]ADV46476.1 hypothetical protein Nitsa_1223 [Nitratifractor salsuginis DSM 16511]
MKLPQAPLGKLVFLSDTDTTVGFLSQDTSRLDRIKGRPGHKRYIHALDSLHTLRRLGRVPAKHRRLVRRRKRTTFILPNGNSFRLIRDPRHLLLLARLGGWAYTTSANRAGAPYDENFARQNADVVVEPLGTPAPPSPILRLGKERIRRIR